MFKSHPILVFVIVLLILSVACSQSGTIVPPDPNAAQTAIVETINAIQAAATATKIPVDSAPTLELSTATASLSPTPESTATPTTPQISVSVDTFCRLGPGREYEKVGILLVGETTEIVARDAIGQFWYVRNPDIGVDFCWMSGEYATLSGNYPALLIQTPPGAQNDFEATYQGQGQCSGAFWSDIRLKNLGGAWFKSMSITVRDTDTNTVHSTTANNFAFSDGCSAPRIVDTLIQGGNILISSPEFSYNLNSHNMSATFILCTELNMTGGCVTKTITYIP